MKFVVYLREKKKGTVEIEATDSLDAIGKAKRLIHLGRCDEMMETSGIIVTGAEAL